MIEDLEKLSGLMEMKEPMGLAEINSSAGDFWQLLQSPIWEDIKRELLVWHDQMGRVYDTLNPSDEDFVPSFSKAQGRREAIEYVLTLPELMIEALEMEKEESHDTGRDETTEH